jgi:hypothetical protein
MSHFFSKTENRKAKQVLSGKLIPVEGGKVKEILYLGEYAGNMYSCTGKIRPVDTIQEMEWEERTRMEVLIQL